MSDRRAVSAGHLGASSVAFANEAWRVAVGGNRVENMTIDQIAQAFRAGHLNARTPLWALGSTGWQALGNFAQFQNPGVMTGGAPAGGAPPGGNYGDNSSYGSNYGNAGYGAGLSQFEEADDDPTRMWTGNVDDLPGADAMSSMHASSMQQRPMARTGTRQVSRPAQSQAVAAAPMAPPPPPMNSRPVASQPAMGTRSLPPPPSLASRTPALVPSNAPAYRRSRGNGLLLVAGLVGLVGLGSAVLAARGNWGNAAQPAPTNVEVSAEAPAVEGRPALVAAAESEAPAAQASKAEASKSEGGEAQLAKFDDSASAASAFVAGESAKRGPAETASSKTESLAGDRKEDRKADSKRDKADDEVSSNAKAERASKAARRRDERIAKRATSVTPKREVAAAPPPSKPEPEPPPAAKAEKPEKVEKVEKVEKTEKAEASETQQAPPANAAVNEAAAAALANSANLASSCRPRGGPAGAGKARVIYSNDGEVQSVEILTAKFRDTLTGSCVRMVFRRAKIPPFKGEPPTFIKSFTIPEE